jgi:uncharacterized iron-regulated membrane protein
MHRGLASVSPIASAKLLLIPLAILGLLLFLLLLGALALGIAMSILAALSWLIRLPGRRYARRLRRRRQGG